MNPKPAMNRLVRYLSDDNPHDPVSVLALALRAALGQCGEQQALAVDEIAELDDDHTAFGRRQRARRLATLEMANRVVRVISEHVEQFDGGSR